jgi:GNAT superfamily N-acetyltransferase
VDDLLWRTYRPSDAPALAALMNAIEEHAGGQAGYTAEELQSLITTLVRDNGTDSTMVLDPAGALVAAGFTTTPPEGGFRIYLTGGVQPQWRGRGIGRRILGRHLDRATQIHRHAAPGAAWVAEVPRAPAGDGDAARLYRRFGLAPVRYWFEMAACTAPVPALTSPTGLHVTPYSARYEAALHAAHMEAFAENFAFQPRDLDSWLTITARSQSFLPELSLLAFDGPELAGYLLTYLHADPHTVYAGELGVRRPWRGQGLASALLAQLLDLAGRAGNKLVTLSVDAASPSKAVGIYERAGFTTESSTVTFSRPLAPLPQD